MRKIQIVAKYTDTVLKTGVGVEKGLIGAEVGGMSIALG